VLPHRHDDVAPLSQGHGNDTLGVTEERSHCMVEAEARFPLKRGTIADRVRHPRSPDQLPQNLARAEGAGAASAGVKQKNAENAGFLRHREMERQVR